MRWYALLAEIMVAVTFITVGVMYGRHRLSARAGQGDIRVTLSVLPSRTAVVILDGEADAPSAALSRLVEHAVCEAFVFRSVDVVEVRGPDGQLLDRRRRPAHQGRKRHARRPGSGQVGPSDTLTRP